MNKTIIAAGASAALAMMPIASVFATPPTAKETLTDSFQFGINHECSFSRVDDVTGEVGSQVHSNGHPTGGTGNANWTAADGTSAPNTASDKIAINLTAGNTGSLGSSKFNVTCNGSDGYKVTAYVVNLTNGTNTISAGNEAVGTSASSWTAVSSSNSQYVTSTASATPDTVATSLTPTPNAGQDFTMTYAVGLADGQASGTYAGSIIYTLVDLTDTADQ